MFLISIHAVSLKAESWMSSEGGACEILERRNVIGKRAPVEVDEFNSKFEFGNAHTP